MSMEAAVSLVTALHSHSPALFAFGGDSLIELLSAAVVFCRFRFGLGEIRAARIAGTLLFALAGFVVLTSVLNLVGYREAQRSLLGIGILFSRIRCDALDSQPQTKVGSYYIERRAASRCSRIYPLRLHGVDYPCGTGGERPVE
jgi:hypothetical protein